MMVRARGQLAVAHGPQRPAQRRLIHADRELLLDPSHQILQPPTHHAIDRRLRAILNKAPQGSTLLSVQFRPRSRMLGVDQPVRPAGVDTPEESEPTSILSAPRLLYNTNLH